MSGKTLLFTHINFLICNLLTGCITRDKVFQPNWISVWSQLKPVGKASHRLQGVVSCLLFLCQGNGNWLFPFEELISTSHLQSAFLPMSQRQQRYSWLGGASSPKSSLKKTKHFSSLSPCPFHFLLQMPAHPWVPTPALGVQMHKRLLGPDSRLAEDKGSVLQERKSWLTKRAWILQYLKTHCFSSMHFLFCSAWLTA